MWRGIKKQLGSIFPTLNLGSLLQQLIKIYAQLLEYQLCVFDMINVDGASARGTMQQANIMCRVLLIKLCDRVCVGQGSFWMLPARMRRPF